MYSIKNTTGPDSKLKLTAIGVLTLYTLMEFCFWLPRGCLQFVIVVFPDHTHFLFLKK